MIIYIFLDNKCVYLCRPILERGTFFGDPVNNLHRKIVQNNFNHICNFRNRSRLLVIMLYTLHHCPARSVYIRIQESFKNPNYPKINKGVCVQMLCLT